MDGNQMSPADYAAMSNGGLGGFEGLIYLAVIASMFGGGWGGFGFGGRGPGVGATQDFIQNGFNFNDLQDQNRDIMNAITNGTAQSVGAANQVYHDIVSYVGDKYSEIARDIAGVGTGIAQIIANANECSGGIRMAIAELGGALGAKIDQAKFENAMGLAGLEQRLTAKMDAAENQRLRDEVAELKDRLNMVGVVKYPMSTTYGVPSPCFGGQPCNCGNM